MKAIVQNEYGSPDLLELREVDVPTPGEDEVLVRVRAAALNAGDYFMVTGRPWAVRMFVGFPKPRNHVLGWDAAGHVEAVGDDVERFRPGDEVFASIGGTCAEFACGAADGFATKPANLSFEEAAAVPTAGLTALQGLRDAGRVKPGQEVLINGASGGVGTFAVQIARWLGAKVTGVCSTRNLEMVRSLGADHVVDYTEEDFTGGGKRYDLILDNVGNHSFSECRRALTPRGTLLPNTGHAGMGYVVKAYVSSFFMRRQGRPFVARSNGEDLELLRKLVESGEVTPVIDRTYPLGEVPAAVHYVGEGHARGKVVIALEPHREA